MAESMGLDNAAPFVSIVVVNYNGARLLVDCLRSVLGHSEYPEYEIVVVDNGSKDNSVDEVMTLFGKSEKVRIIPLARNFGFAEGCNRGYSESSPRARYIVLLNNDVVVRRGWLRSLVMALEEDEEIGVAQPLIPSPRKDSEGLFGGYIDVFGDIWTGHQPKSKSPHTTTECFYAWGAAIIARRELIQEIGLFNPRYFWLYEDTDFCWRARLAGYKVAIVPSSEVYHFGSATMAGYASSPVVSFHHCKNKLYTLLVNYETRNVLKYVPWAIIPQIGRILEDVMLSVLKKKTDRRFHKARGFGKLSALFYILAHFPDIWKNRLIVQRRIRRRSDKDIIGKYIIVPKLPLPRLMLEKMRRTA